MITLSHCKSSLSDRERGKYMDMLAMGQGVEGNWSYYTEFCRYSVPRKQEDGNLFSIMSRERGSGSARRVM